MNTDGTLDTGFAIGSGTNGIVQSITFQPDGKILIGGNFTIYNGIAKQNLVRLNSDGTIDTSFNIGGSGANGTGSLYGIAIQPDGKIIIGGNFISYNGTARGYIARLHSNGTLDASYATGVGANSSVYGMTLQTDGKVLI